MTAEASRPEATAMTDALPPIILEVETSVPPALAWAALTEPRRVAEWFTDASPVGRPGARYRLDFGEGSVVEGVIVSLEPGRQFSHTWTWADIEPPMETLVTWRVEPLEAGGTRIVLVHDGWATSGADEALRDDHEGYWTGYLDDLAAILSEGG